MDKVETLKRQILENFKQNNVNTSGNYYEFVPHLTTFKIKSRPNAQAASADIVSEKKIFMNTKQYNSVRSLVDEVLWAKYASFYFGTETLTTVELCKMCNIFEFKSYPVEFSASLCE